MYNVGSLYVLHREFFSASLVLPFPQINTDNLSYSNYITLFIFFSSLSFFTHLPENLCHTLPVHCIS